MIEMITVLQIFELTTFCLLFLLLIYLIIQRVRKGKWDHWTGFGELFVKKTDYHPGSYRPGRTLWDILGLLIVPVTLGCITILYSNFEKEKEDRISLTRYEDASLQSYIDKLSELIIHDHLTDPDVMDEVKAIANIRTISVLRNLSPARKEIIVRFLYDAALITKKDQNSQPIISLAGADLEGISLIDTNLSDIDLSGANLKNADLSESKLNGGYLAMADLSYSHLAGTDLRGVDLFLTDISYCNLEGAYVSAEQLKRAIGLENVKGLEGGQEP